MVIDDQAVVRQGFVALINTVADMEVIAEGIETDDQYQQLRTLGCEYGQGYLFSPPVNVEAVLHLLVQDAHRESEPGLPLPETTDEEMTVGYSM